jgi:integrase
VYYLDYRQNGQRRKESLNIYHIHSPKNETERFANKNALELVERLQAQKLIELQDQRYGTKRIDTSHNSYYEFYQRLMRERIGSDGNYGNWASALQHLKIHFGEKLYCGDLTIESCLEFRNYLERHARTRSRKPLSPNSRYSYLNKFKASLKIAYKEKLIHDNLSDFIPGFRQAETHREYLTFDEIQALVDTECDYPEIKRAFLFSCLTGLRYSDIARLTWSCLRHTDKRGYELSYRQKKTGGKEYLPLSEQAVEMMGERGMDDKPVFPYLYYSNYVNAALYRWVANAGVRKKITFHCARHTHAVLLLENDVDIYTVSKMLGHRELKTTQIYAKIVDTKKVAAASSLPKLRLG